MRPQSTRRVLGLSRTKVTRRSYLRRATMLPFRTLAMRAQLKSMPDKNRLWTRILVRPARCIRTSRRPDPLTLFSNSPTRLPSPSGPKTRTTLPIMAILVQRTWALRTAKFKFNYGKVRLQHRGSKFIGSSSRNTSSNLTSL